MSDPSPTPQSPPPVRGQINLGKASMVFGLIGLLFATAAIYFLFGDSVERGFKIAIVAISLLVTISAAVMGLAAVFGKSVSGKGAAVSGLLLGGVSLFVLGFAIIAIPMQKIIAASRSASHSVVDSAPIVVAPIELSSDAKSASEVSKRWRKWLLENAIDPTKKKIEGRWNEEVTGRILDAYLADWVRAPDRPSQEDWNRLSADLTDIRRYGEPLSRLILTGKAQLPRDLASLITPIKELRKTETNPFWLLVLELQASAAYTGTNNTGRLRGSDEKALDAFEQLIEEDWFEGDEWWLLADLTSFAHFPEFFERGSEHVVEILENHDVPEWFLRYMRGQRFSRLAWNARGSGMANTVTEDGWKSFRDLQAKARHELEQAWELAPDYPFAASKMISVAMADSDDPVVEMRLWFDRSIAAQCDYWPAYNNWLWGMHPRWHGNHDAMLEFGEHCLATERFDTRVPGYYLSVVREVLKDSDSSWSSLKDEYQKLRSLCLDIADHAEDERTVQEWKTLLAVLAYRTRNHDEVRKQVTELQGNLDPEILESWLITQEIFDFRAALGKGSETVQMATDKEGDDRLQEAVALYRKAAVESETTTEERAVIERRIAVVELESQYESGEWIELIPGVPDLWRPVEGSFQVAEDGGFSVTSDTVRSVIEHPMVIGQHCEIEWEIDTPDDQISALGPGVMLSSSRFDTLRWNAFYVSQVDGTRSYKVSRYRYRSDMRVDAEKKDRITMRLVCHGKKWLAYVDGEKVHRGDIELNSSFFGTSSRLALGAFTSRPTKDCVINYHRLRIRKLPIPTEALEE